LLNVPATLTAAAAGISRINSTLFFRAMAIPSFLVTM
jgi:hypothetical protein